MGHTCVSNLNSMNTCLTKHQDEHKKNQNEK